MLSISNSFVDIGVLWTSHFVCTRAAQPVACRPHLARRAVLCGPQGLFERLIFSWNGLAYHFVANKTMVKTKTFFGLVFPKSLWICGEDRFFCLHLLLEINFQKKLAEMSIDDLRRRPFLWSSPTFGERSPKY